MRRLNFLEDEPWDEVEDDVKHVRCPGRKFMAIVDRLRNQGFDTVGKVQDYGNIYRLCYVRGPEGLIVELAEQIAS